MKLTTEALAEIIFLIVQKGLPEAVKLLASLKKENPTAAEVRALKEDMAPPVVYGDPA